MPGTGVSGIDLESLKKRADGYLNSINKQKKTVMNLQIIISECEEKKKTIKKSHSSSLSAMAAFDADPKWIAKKDTNLYITKRKKMQADIEKWEIMEMNRLVDCGIINRHMEMAKELEKGMESQLATFKTTYNIV